MTNAWRTMVMRSMSAAELPVPPLEVFVQPERAPARSSFSASRRSRYKYADGGHVRPSATISALAGLLALVGCGLKDESTPECALGDRRLSSTRCPDAGADAYQVERCEDSGWVIQDECSEPDDCQEGETVDTDATCGELQLSFNRELRRCAGGLLQAPECACGAAESTRSPSYGLLHAPEDAWAFYGMTYPSQVRVEGSFTLAVTTSPEPLGEIRCIDYLSMSGLSPAFASLFAVGGLRLGSTPVSGLASLRYIEELEIDAEDARGLEAVREIKILTDRHGSLKSLRGLEGVEELGEAYLFSQGLESLDGLEGLRRLSGTLDLDTPALRDISALAGLTEVEGGLLLARAVQLTDFTGLHNLRKVGALTLRIESLDQLETFERLEEAGYIRVDTTPELGCAVRDFFKERVVDRDPNVPAAVDCPE